MKRLEELKAKFLFKILYKKKKKYYHCNINPGTIGNIYSPVIRFIFRLYKMS